MLLCADEKREKILQRIKNFCLMDDDFMTKFFENDLESTSLLLQIILDMPKLKVLESVSQYNIKNLHGRSIRLDVKATDENGKIYDIEIQRADKGAGAERARYNSALLDANMLLEGEKVDKLRETYVIFITENDVLGAGKAVYHIDRIIAETKTPFGDGSHIIYVNGAYKGTNLIGDLMHDFNCKKPADMKIKHFASKAKFLKEDNKGVSQMCQIVEELLQEERLEEKEEIVTNLIKQNILSVEQIAEVANITTEDVQKIAQKYACDAC